MALIDIAALAADEVAAAIADEIAREGTVAVAINSKALASASYSSDGVLSVTFTDGQSYDYPPGVISEDDFHHLVTAHSVGRYFNTYIRGRG
jgi:hypothetical protein